MMRRFALTALLALLPLTASAGTITLDLGGAPLTITTPARQDAVVADIVAKINVQISEQNARNQADNNATLATWNAENTRRAALTPPLDPLPAPALKTISPPQTREQYVRSILVQSFRSWVTDANKADVTTACATFKTLSAARQNAIMTELGNKSPCE